MSSYLTKSTHNLKCAEMIAKQGVPLSVASAHVAYYSAFQLMKYILAQFMDLPYGQHDVIAKGKDSHNSLLVEFVKRLSKKMKQTTVNTIRTLLTRLKMIRQRCDYNTDNFSQIQLDNNVASAKGFYNTMSNMYNF